MFTQGRDILGVWMCQRENMRPDDFPKVLVKSEYPAPLTCFFRLDHIMLDEEMREADNVEPECLSAM
jgi:hypothetical protein